MRAYRLLVLALAAEAATALRPERAARCAGARPIRLGARARVRTLMQQQGELRSAGPQPQPEGNARTEGMPIVAVSAAIFNMMIGTGAFCLPASAVGVSLPLALGIVSALGTTSAGTFALIGQLVGRTGASTLDELWRLSQPPVRALPSLLQIIVSFYSLGTLVQYQVSLGELLAPATGALVRGLGTSVSWLTLDSNRLAVLLSAPLLLFGALRWRNLAALTGSSVVGVFAKAFSAGLLVWRALDGSYGPGGAFFDASAAASAVPQPFAPPVSGASAGPGSLAQTGAAFALVAASSTAFMCHLNIPSYYTQLSQPSATRFGTATVLAFAGGTLVYLIIVVAARALFGDNVSDFALSSFAPADACARAAQLATAVGVLSSYLLMMLALKTTLSTGQIGESTVALFGGPGRGSTACLAALGEQSHGEAEAVARRVDTRLTICIFLATTGLALCAASNLLLVVALRGAFLGTALTYVVPALIGLGLTGGVFKGINRDRESAGQRVWRRTGAKSRPALWALLVAGCMTMVLATSAVLDKYFG